jgi:hypothetical protein
MVERCGDGSTDRDRVGGGLDGQEAALRDDEFRLLDGGRRDAEAVVQHRGDERNPAGAADEHQAGDRVVGHAAAAQGRFGEVDGAVEQGPGEAFELVPGDVHVGVEDGQMQVGG